MINIYILRHGIAVKRGTKPFPNDDRPLTDEGIEKISKAAQGIIKIIDKLDVILTSPMIRANDTAKIVAKTFNALNKIQICKELAPGGSLKIFLSYIAKFKRCKDIMIVGHQPDLSYFASALLGKNKPVIEFKKGALCCIQVKNLPLTQEGTLLWHLSPKQLRLIAK